MKSTMIVRNTMIEMNNKHDHAIGCEAFMEVKIGQDRWK